MLSCDGRENKQGDLSNSTAFCSFATCSFFFYLLFQSSSTKSSWLVVEMLNNHQNKRNSLFCNSNGMESQFVFIKKKKKFVKRYLVQIEICKVYSWKRFDLNVICIEIFWEEKSRTSKLVLNAIFWNRNDWFVLDEVWLNARKYYYWHKWRPFHSKL